MHLPSEYIVGIDVGGTNIRCALAQADDPTRLIIHRSAETPVPVTPEGFLDFVETQIERCMVDAGIRREDLSALGCAVPGVVDVRQGAILAASNLAWTDVPLVDLLSRRFGLPAYIENDVRAAAIGEYAHGAAEGCSSVVYLTVSTGIAIGIIVEGKVMRGFHQAAGEMCYFVPDPQHVGVEWGVNGCLESTSGGVGLARLWAAHLGVSETSTSAAAVFQAAEAGDETAKALVERAATYIAQAAIAITTIVDPEVLVLGGSIAQHQPVIMQRMRDVVNGMLPLPPSIIPAALGGDAPLIGALTLAAESRLAGRDRVISIEN